MGSAGCLKVILHTIIGYFLDSCWLSSSLWAPPSVNMSETHDESPDDAAGGVVARFRHRRKAKAYRVLEGKLRYVVGRDIYLDIVEALCSRTLIGRLEYASMDKKDWFAWATDHWKPFLSYVPAISLLVRGG